jgi:hypothetical protein
LIQVRHSVDTNQTRRVKQSIPVYHLPDCTGLEAAKAALKQVAGFAAVPAPLCLFNTMINSIMIIHVFIHALCLLWLFLFLLLLY